ncbi:endosome-associated-trafficking regulator 1 isoform X1 [Phycodurus eques]|uniref:endosome-associated-trafficking regulator 1 isoform X1 n=1 Tax=Phycodurus eques TaxID=693459 RepID=UPI002ACEAF5A|nr:endosome-associated-trafficking regulator 1 isoform X1 [Phycodurus eques]
MATRGSRGKTLIFSEDGEELNPFSFREFLRTKDRNRNRKRTRTRTCQCGGCVRIETRLRFYRGDDDVTQPIGSRGRSLQELHEENVSLTRAISALRRTSEANGRRAEALEEELQRGRQREEEEARDLEDTVRSVERNLREMTKRALRAESSVCGMKAELRQLQEELECARCENAKLRSSECDVVTAMKQNANMASDYLDKTTTRAHSSISQLLEGAESLRLVSQLLRSIHKMADVTSDA